MKMCRKQMGCQELNWHNLKALNKNNMKMAICTNTKPVRTVLNTTSLSIQVNHQFNKSKALDKVTHHHESPTLKSKTLHLTTPIYYQTSCFLSYLTSNTGRTYCADSTKIQ